MNEINDDDDAMSDSLQQPSITLGCRLSVNLERHVLQKVSISLEHKASFKLSENELVLNPSLSLLLPVCTLIYLSSCY